MNFAHLHVHILKSRHHTQLGLDNMESFPKVYGTNKVRVAFYFYVLHNMSR